MELHVKFTGLCMFVRDPAKPLVHVLMPATPADVGGTHVHTHDLTLAFAGGGSRSMRDWYVDLSTVKGSGTLLDPPVEALDAGTPAAAKVPASQLGATPTADVVARVTLPAAGRCEIKKRVQWKVKLIENGTVVSESGAELTHELTWIIPDADLSVFESWQRHPLPTNPIKNPEALPEPKVSGGVISLHFKHLPHTPMWIIKGQEATHFQAFYSLFATVPRRRAHPFLNQFFLMLAVLRVLGFLRILRFIPHERVGGSPFNCMLAQSGAQ